MDTPQAQGFCTNCGQPLPAGAAQCPRCGAMQRAREGSYSIMLSTPSR